MKWRVKMTWPKLSSITSLTLLAHWPQIPIGQSMQDQAPSNLWTQTPLVMTTSTSAGWKKPALKPSSPADFDWWRLNKRKNPSSHLARFTSDSVPIPLKTCNQDHLGNVFYEDWMSLLVGTSGIRVEGLSRITTIYGLARLWRWVPKDFTPLNAEVLAVNTLETTHISKAVDQLMTTWINSETLSMTLGAPTPKPLL